jgi:hypothetical protein
MKIKFSFLVALAAALIAGCAAYYSVFGLSQLFAGASTAVIVMASSLEFSKIIAVSFLHRYWNKISRILKIYLTIGVFVLICITSAGIYGFLSNAYQKTANKLEISEGQLGVLNGKKDLFQKNIDDNQRIIDSKNNRLSQLSSLRTAQETRLDAATTNSARSKARGDINSSNTEIQKLNLEIDNLSQKNVSLLDSVNVYSTKSIESKTNNSVTGEVGPLKYLAQLTGYPMDKVVNFFILLLIFVFDPLAVSLVIATNKVLEIEKNNEEPQPKAKPKNEKNWVRGVISSIKKKELISEPVEEQVVEEVKIEEPVVEEIQPSVETDRGFSMNIPTPNNVIERIGSNKIVKDGDKNKFFFKRRG